MRTVITSIITKLFFVMTFFLITTTVLGQNSKPDISSGVPCTVITPGPVTGLANVCAVINTGDQLTYSIDPLPLATSYEWIVPPTVTVVSGQGTTSLVITIDAGFATSANKLIKVRALYPCGISEYRLFYLKAQYPGTPKPIVAGSTDICSFVGTGNAVSYTIRAVPGASSYDWINPANTTMLHPNGAGANDTTVVVLFLNGFTGGDISVQCSNNCGISGIRALSIGLNPPSKPGLISGTSSVCDNIAPSGTPLTYSVSPVDGATSYDWTAPAGSVVTHPNGPGQNDFSITVLYPAGFVTGTITVSCSNSCGTSAIRSLAVKRLRPSAPGAITATEISGCPNRVYTYSVAALPLNSTSIDWTLPTGGTIISGQGGTLLTVAYTPDAVNGNVTATGVSNCGTGQARTLAVHLLACTDSFQSPLLSRNSGIQTPDQGIMVLNVSPNPTVGDFRVRVSSKEKGNITVRILDLTGKLIRRMATVRNETIVFGSDLNPGNYIMEVIQGNHRRIQKLVKL